MSLKNDLRNQQSQSWRSESSSDQLPNTYHNGEEPPSQSWMKPIIIIVFLVVGGLYISDYLPSSFTPEKVIQEAIMTTTNSLETYDPELLESMGKWMERMGYEGLTNEDLTELRRAGVTATFTQKIRDLGYTPSLEDLKLLKEHDVSDTFASMMHSLGYTELTLDDLINLRVHNVTAHFTSNMYDMGYTDISKEDLVRLRDARVSISDVKKVNERRQNSGISTPATIEDLIRYGISNQ